MDAGTDKEKEFLAQIERIIPWEEWESIIKPHYSKGKCGNKPYALDLMLRLHILQNLYDLSDEATAEEVIDSRAFSAFCGADLSSQVLKKGTIVDSTLILAPSSTKNRDPDAHSVKKGKCSRHDHGATVADGKRIRYKSKAGNVLSVPGLRSNGGSMRSRRYAPRRGMFSLG